MREALVPTQSGEYDSILAYEPKEFPWEEVEKRTIKARKKKGPATYCRAFGTFDIESTTMIPEVLGYKKDGSPIYKERPYGFMYHWQMCIDGINVYGRYWQEWINFLQELEEKLHISKENHFVIYIHNAAYEFQFCHNFLSREFGELKIFASKKRKPMYFVTPNGFEFRCSYFLSNMSLYKATINELGVKHIKAKGDLDYKKLRTPSTPLDDTEFSYCIGDVISLWEYIKSKLHNENDTIESIPLTSTGYVRRDCRNATKKEKGYRVHFNKMRLKANTYRLLKEEGRGGNTHCCRWMSGRIWEWVYSFDEVSAYPAMLLLKKYPVSKFFYYGEITSIAELEELSKEKATIFRVIFQGLRLKDRVPMPYIAVSKALYRPQNYRADNGRILSADTYIGTFNCIDWEIIKSQYEWDSIAISDVYAARWGYLPESICNSVRNYFQAKSELKDKNKQIKKAMEKEPDKVMDLKEEADNIAYLYMKSKNRLNGIFGMMYTDIVNSEVSFEDDLWEETKPNSDEGIEEAIDKYMNNRNSFLYYAWGSFCTSWARAHLQRLIDMTSDITKGSECIYCDTDSSKCINPDFEAINAANEEIIAECEERRAYADVNGTRYYMGIYENETGDKPYKKFISLGAKKYAYEDEEGLHITISGVAKSGVEEMQDITDFHDGFTFYNHAGSTLYYNDSPDIYTIHINGEEIESSSNIGMIDSTYTIGITPEYSSLIGYDMEREL